MDTYTTDTNDGALDYDAVRALIHKLGPRDARRAVLRMASRKHAPKAQRRAALRSVTAHAVTE
jgi:hypothetical protein